MRDTSDAIEFSFYRLIITQVTEIRNYFVQHDESTNSLRRISYQIFNSIYVSQLTSYWHEIIESIFIYLPSRLIERLTE